MKIFKLINFALSYLTTWANISFILIIIFKNYIPVYLEHTITSIMLTASLLGNIFIYKYQKNISDKLIKIFKIVDLITHVTPLLYIIFFMKRKKLNTNKYDILISIFMLIIGKIYISKFDPKKVYYFTKYSNNQLLIISYTTFLLFFYLLK
jgi:hypothetical protein